MKPILSILIFASALALILLISPAAAQPRIVLNPEAIEVELNAGFENWGIPVNLSNEGDEDLIWNLEIEYITSPNDQENWIIVRPFEGQVNPGDNLDLGLIIGEGALNGDGEYIVELRFLSNDPENPQAVIDFSMVFNQEGGIVARWDVAWGYPDLVDWNRAFDRMAVGEVYTLTIMLLNVGEEAAIVGEIACDNPRFQADLDGFIRIQPNQQVPFDVAVQAQAAGLQEGYLTFQVARPAPLSPIHLRALIPWALGFRVNLAQGWNLVAAPFEPINPEIRAVFELLLAPDALRAVKSQYGCFYLPAFNFNNIESWDFRYGYWVSVTRETVLPFDGERVPPDTPIPLRRGWNIVSYFPETERDQMEAFFNIADELIIVKDGHGRFYWPEQDFNNMELMCQGVGYQVKVTRNVVLVWNE